MSNQDLIYCLLSSSQMTAQSFELLQMSVEKSVREYILYSRHTSC